MKAMSRVIIDGVLTVKELEEHWPTFTKKDIADAIVNSIIPAYKVISQSHNEIHGNIVPLTGGTPFDVALYGHCQYLHVCELLNIDGSNVSELAKKLNTNRIVFSAKDIAKADEEHHYNTMRPTKGQRIFDSNVAIGSDAIHLELINDSVLAKILKYRTFLEKLSGYDTMPCKAEILKFLEEDKDSSKVGQTTKASKALADKKEESWRKDVEIAVRLAVECAAHPDHPMPAMTTQEHQSRWTALQGGKPGQKTRREAFRTFRNALPGHLKKGKSEQPEPS